MTGTNIRFVYFLKEKHNFKIEHVKIASIHMLINTHYFNNRAIKICSNFKDHYLFLFNIDITIKEKNKIYVKNCNKLNTIASKMN